MRKFKVLVIGHQLKNKVVAPFGTVVDENQLLGNADELVKAGFVEEIKGEDSKEDSFNLDAMKKEELIAFAKLNNFVVTETAKKSDILDEIDAQLKEMEIKGEVIVKE